jgi:hypothetical protein
LRETFAIAFAACGLKNALAFSKPLFVIDQNNRIKDFFIAIARIIERFAPDICPYPQSFIIHLRSE